MPLPLSKEPVVPNAVFAPNVILRTTIGQDGQLITSAHVTLKGGCVDAQGKWTPADSQTKVFYIPNIFALESDISQYQGQALQLFEQFVALIGYINSIKRII
ncbi:MAG: hypothetical protein ABFD79_08070 [Phycisphaerales bacterium]